MAHYLLSRSNDEQGGNVQLPNDLKDYHADAFQLVTGRDVLRLLLLWACVAMVLDTAGLL